VDSDNPDLLITKVNFTGKLTTDSFVPVSTNPLLRIKFFKKWTKGNPFEGGFGDIWIDNPKERYQYQNVQIPAPVSASKNIGTSQTDSRVDLSSCAAKTWIDPSGLGTWLKFSISMTCIRLPDKFAVIAFVDSDINANFQPDNKFAPATPMEVDLSGISRPKPKDEQSVSISTQSALDLRTTAVEISARSVRTNLEGVTSQGLPIQYTSVSPEVCKFSSPISPTLSLLKSGTCTVEVFAPGDDKTADSNKVQMNFPVNPKPMVNQEIYWEEPIDVTETDGEINLGFSTSSGLPLQVTSFTPNICFFKNPSINPSVISILGPGNCEISVSQEGNDEFYSRSSTASFYIAPKVVEKEQAAPKTPSSSGPSNNAPKRPKLLGGGSVSTDKQNSVDIQKDTGKANAKATSKTSTIICKKGILTKKVIAKNPKCPTGYKKQ
jgi:hypothetical protein